MKILAVFAHPDDEAFGPAGTLSRYALNGHTVHLATMTRGEAGSLGRVGRGGSPAGATQDLQG